jgi:hypothetical protein
MTLNLMRRMSDFILSGKGRFWRALVACGNGAL